MLGDDDGGGGGGGGGGGNRQLMTDDNEIADRNYTESVGAVVVPNGCYDLIISRFC